MYVFTRAMSSLPWNVGMFVWFDLLEFERRGRTDYVWGLGKGLCDRV